MYKNLRTIYSSQRSESHHRITSTQDHAASNIMIFPTLFYVNRVNYSVALCFIPINTSSNGIAVRNYVRSAMWCGYCEMSTDFINLFYVVVGICLFDMQGWDLFGIQEQFNVVKKPIFLMRWRAHWYHFEIDHKNTQISIV